MTSVYQNSQENEHLLTKIENQNGNANIANIASDEITLLNAIAQEFKIRRQQLQDIATYIRQTSDIDTLFKVTVAQIREKLTCDRALIYQFTSFDSGNVLA
jgi:methyl-accepting chemotaxis protein PixJ